MVDRSRLSKAEKEFWEALQEDHDFVFPSKDATLRITKRVTEEGSVYLNPFNGEMFVYAGKRWRKLK